ncbi:NPCBM/NEW2 domain-containing protein [Kitasatospora cineracea]|uniref:NPCBM/NEW2 domain-containing protein n=1 Tax=Kitasatospora cineracea TaxID=88074 RepID=A0A8G1XFG8_9ACTN|nr:NPCBM/NEW2 domain-containing protein [Kitasatospora cineracea]ROR46416.1 NPCBM/NEW2 domain-containing protein [Kitasatospora cineracea]
MASVPSHGVVMYEVSSAGTTNATAPSAGTHSAGDLPRLAFSTGWGTVRTDSSVDGNALTIGGTAYGKGIGTHADSGVHLWLGGACRNFSAQVGVDDEVGANGSVSFQVYGDGRLLTTSGVKQGGQAATHLSASTTGVKELELRVTDARDGIDYDHADWADAQLACGSVTYEAEAAGNTRSGAAAPRACTACSGGQTMGDIGNTPANYLVVNNVTAAAAGNQPMAITYELSGTRSLFVSVNGGSDTQVTLTGTDWSKPTTSTVTVPLNAGANTVKFHNDTAYAPDIDAITIG